MTEWPKFINNRGRSAIVALLMVSFFPCSASDLEDTMPKRLFDIIKSQGFYEIGNRKFFKSNYNNLYRNFDYFIESMQQNSIFAELMYISEKEFLSVEGHKLRYCSAPPSFRDPKEHTQKRFSKIYFQFIKEYYDLIKEKYSEELNNNPDAQCFFEAMLKVDKIAKETFAAIIETIEKSYPGFKQVMYGKHDELTVVTKIVRYQKTDDPEQWGTTAHFDKSGLSLIWDSNDDDDDSLLICEDTINPSMEELIKPTRIHSHKRGLTSAILIPGLALAKVGIDMKATLHGVAPIQKEHRYAVISFALIPDISMSDLKTDFI